MCLPLRIFSRCRRSANSNIEDSDTIGGTNTNGVQEIDSATSVSSKTLLNSEAVTFIPAKPIVQVSGFDFERVTELPSELKMSIFEYVLKMEKPILPHLCDKEGTRGEPKFHDDNASSHGYVWMLTSLTRVSKKIRKESLPVFYSTNSFAIGSDTVTYFAYLQSLERFDWVFRVNLVIHFQPEKYAAWVLRCVNQFDNEVESHERNSFESIENAPSNPQVEDEPPPAVSLEADASGSDKITMRLKPLQASGLRRHPRYHVGGISDLNLAILIRMLSTSSSCESKFRRRIVLPISNASAFDIDSGLRWFPTVIEGLRMELRFVVRPDTATLNNRLVMLEWNRRFQGCEDTVAGPKGKPGEIVMKRALEMFPDLEAMRRPRKSCYYRRACHSPLITWYDMPTMGGGRW